MRRGLLGLCLPLSMALAGADEAPELQLIRAWSIEHPARLDPSGICLLDGVVYVVSDNNGDLRAGSEDDRRPWLFVFESPLRY